ncbi:MAG TPA: hypothetical protein VJV76_02305 [Gaiellaceae bacterium]|nr:hypothetical protein [Gaiellaceae bacterium]
MVDALSRLQAALVPGGVLVDTQPVSLRLPVALDEEPIGELEDDRWLEMVAAVDAEVDKALAAGLFELRHEERYGIVHEFDSGDECLDVVDSWAGTTVPATVAARLEGASVRTTVEHDVRLRLYRRPRRIGTPR